MFEPTGRYWIFVILTLMLTAIIGYGTQATARLLKEWTPDENILLMPAENVLRIALVPLLIGLAMLSGLPLDNFGLHSQNAMGELMVGLGAGLLIALLFVVSTLWIHHKDVDQRIYSTTILDAILPRTGREAVLVALAMIPTVLIEEILFRSLLIGGLQPLLDPISLLIITGLLFGSLHSPQGAWGIIGATLAGFAFGGLFLWRGGLIAPVVAHYVANMVQIGIATRLYR